MSKRKTKVFKVSVPNLQTVSDAEWKSYINSAVRAWCGQAQMPAAGDPPDPEWLMVLSDRMHEVKVTGTKR